MKCRSKSKLFQEINSENLEKSFYYVLGIINAEDLHREDSESIRDFNFCCTYCLLFICQDYITKNKQLDRRLVVRFVCAVTPSIVTDKSKKNLFLKNLEDFEECIKINFLESNGFLSCDDFKLFIAEVNKFVSNSRHFSPSFINKDSKEDSENDSNEDSKEELKMYSRKSSENLLFAMEKNDHQENKSGSSCCNIL